MATKFCIFSGSSENLNTSMSIKLDDGKMVEVWISDDYVDQATPKAVKEAYLKSQQELIKLTEAAAKFGMKLVPIDQAVGNVSVQSQQPNINQHVQSHPMRSSQPQQGDVVVQAPSVKAPSPNQHKKIRDFNPTIKIEGGLAGELGSNEAYQMQLDENAIVEAEIVQVRGGVQAPIPKTTQDKNGTLDIAVVKGAGDQGIQRIFKDAVNASQNKEFCFREGYTVKFVTCPMCRGSKVMIGGGRCKKCNGMGEIEVNAFK